MISQIRNWWRTSSLEIKINPLPSISASGATMFSAPLRILSSKLLTVIVSMFSLMCTYKTDEYRICLFRDEL